MLQAARCPAVAARPPLLLAALAALSAALSAATSPDTALICLTPVYVYVAAATAALDPMVLAAAHLGAAAAAGLLLPAGNVVNLVVAAGFDLSFARFAGWMALPTLGEAAGLGEGAEHRQRRQLQAVIFMVGGRGVVEKQGERRGWKKEKTARGTMKQEVPWLGPCARALLCAGTCMRPPAQLLPCQRTAPSLNAVSPHRV